VRERIGVQQTLKSAGVDTAEALADLNDDRLSSVIIDATGNQHSMENAINPVTHGGRIIFVELFQGSMSFDDPTY